MFTGIIRHQGKINATKKTLKGMTLTVQASKKLASLLKIGSSISCNGVCLTVVKKKIAGPHLFFNVFLMNETLRLTSFANAQTNTPLNLEPSLRLGDELGGHLMFGHVDGVGTISNLTPDGDATFMTVKIPKKIIPFVVYKGSIGVEGISLTITHVKKDSIVISLIPHTLKATNLQTKKQGNLVNIEVDMLARYIQRHMRTK